MYSSSFSRHCASPMPLYYLPSCHGRFALLVCLLCCYAPYISVLLSSQSDYGSCSRPLSVSCIPITTECLSVAGSCLCCCYTLLFSTCLGNCVSATGIICQAYFSPCHISTLTLIRYGWVLSQATGASCAWGDLAYWSVSFTWSYFSFVTPCLCLTSLSCWHLFSLTVPLFASRHTFLWILVCIMD